MASALNIDTCVPLVVDLDGTLIVTDTLHESFAKLLFRSPLAALGAALQLPRGPAAVKRAIAARSLPDPASVPLRGDLIAILHAEKARGRALHLVSAADQAVVDAVAGELPLFQ